MAPNVIAAAADFLDASSRRIDVDPAKPRREQVTAAEDVWRQIVVAAVVTMEEAPFLVTVQRAIDGIQIQDDLDGRLLVRLDEAIDEQRFKCTRYMRDPVIAAAGRSGA